MILSLRSNQRVKYKSNYKGQIELDVCSMFARQFCSDFTFELQQQVIIIMS